jgi:hypothetical protein
LFLDLPEVFLRDSAGATLRTTSQLNIFWLRNFLGLGLGDLLLWQLVLCIEGLLKVLEVFVHLVHYEKKLCQKQLREAYCEGSN